MRDGKRVIAVISTSPLSKCGIGLYTHTILKNLDPDVREKVAVLVNGSPNLKKPREIDGVLYIPTWVLGSSFLSAVKLFLHIMRHGYRVVHLQHEWLLYGSLFANIYNALMLALLRFFRRTTVVTFHTVVDIFHVDDEINHYIYKFRKRVPSMYIVKKLIKLVVKLHVYASKLVIVHTPLMKETLVKHYQSPEGKILVIPHYIEEIPLMDKQSAKEALGLKGKKVVLLFGFIRYGKGYEYVIEAFRDVAKEVEDAVLLIAGSAQNGRYYYGEEYLSFLKRLVEDYGIQDRVLFINKFIPKDEARLIFSAADVIVLPYIKGRSYYSSSGVLHQAIGARLPVIGSRTMQLIDVKLSRLGELVDVTNKDELRGAIVRFLQDDRLRAECSKNAEALLESRRIERVARMYSALYRKLAEASMG